jgi:hypothetical protein
VKVLILTYSEVSLVCVLLRNVVCIGLNPPKQCHEIQSDRNNDKKSDVLLGVVPKLVTAFVRDPCVKRLRFDLQWRSTVNRV